jgi:cellulose synthase/poly-beta-1,6-N-acetylglucosamine synthase-like glycosyltransferase
VALAADRGTQRRPPRGSHRRRHPDDGLPYLPVPPDDQEKVSYADRNIALIIRASLASFGALLISQFKFIRVERPLLFLAPLLVFTVLYYLISLCVNINTRAFDIEAHRRLVSAWRPYRYPSLDIFLPVCGEPLAVLHNTWSYVYELMKTYPGTATAYILDDGAGQGVAAMARDYGFVYMVRPDNGWMKKAGNLRHAFTYSFGDYILILDADFAPRADMALEMLPYLEADPSLGIVQSPQYFHVTRGQSWTERGAGAVQELFYRITQVSRDQHDGAICVGSCALYRRDALRVNGGTTLIEHSEDVHTGFDLRRNGWGLRYIPVPLATGLCPADPDSFLTQQYRWCAGSMSLLGSRKFWTTKMRWRTRFCYLSGFCYYLHTAAFIFAAPVIPLAMLLLLPERVHLINYMFVLPSIIYNFAVFPAWHRCRFGPSALMAKLMYGWAHLIAIWDIVRGRRMGWQTTGGVKRKSGTQRIWTGIALWNGTTSVSWMLIALWRGSQFGAANFSVLFAGGVVASVTTGMALFSRRNHVQTMQARARELRVR